MFECQCLECSNIGALGFLTGIADELVRLYAPKRLQYYTFKLKVWICQSVSIFLTWSQTCATLKSSIQKLNPSKPCQLSYEYCPIWIDPSMFKCECVKTILGWDSPRLYKYFLSASLWNCFLCWDRGNGDLPPTLDAALLCISRAGYFIAGA